MTSRSVPVGSAAGAARTGATTGGSAAASAQQTPGFVAPMLAVAGVLPTGGGWSAEVKWDGIRLLTAVDTDGTVRCWTRAAREVGRTWPEVTRRVSGRGGTGSQPACSVVLDGEIVVLDPAGRPSFARLQQRVGQTAEADVRRAAVTDPAVLMLFDVLALDGADTTGLAWEERRALLEGLLHDGVAIGGASLAGRGWQVPAAHPDPAALHAFTLARGLEGVVCKRHGSPYRPGARSEDWVKVKHVGAQEVVLGGWLPGQGNRSGGLGALLLGIPDELGRRVPGRPGEPGLRFVGRVGTGFDARARRALLTLLGPLGTDRCPFTDIPTRDAREARWVEPVVVGEVAYAEWTVNRRLRHPAWRGLRTDRSPADMVAEAVPGVSTAGR